MLQLLQINGMTDLTFTLANIITIGAGVIATMTSFLKLQYDQRAEAKATVVRFETTEKANQKEMEELNVKILHVTNGKRALKKDLINMIEKESEVAKSRIDKTQERIEDYKKATDSEFKEINGALNKIIGLLEAQK